MDIVANFPTCVRVHQIYVLMVRKKESYHALAISVLTLFFLVISFTEQICIETFSSEGYICRETPDLSNSLVVKGVMGDPGFLSDFLQTFIEQQLVS